MRDLLKRLVQTITLARVVLWSCAIFVAGLLYTAYEHHDQLFASLAAPPVINPIGLTFTVGDETRKIIKARVLGDGGIKGISIVSADLRLNETRTLYFFGDDLALIHAFEDADRTSNGRQPLFTNSDSSNTEVIRLINGQFTCRPFMQTLEAGLYPSLISTLHTVCRSSIPAYYGYFSGIVTIYLSDGLTAERQAQLQQLGDRLATDIYFRDVVPTQRSEAKPWARH